jgi:hypothetical protein
MSRSSPYIAFLQALSLIFIYIIPRICSTQALCIIHQYTTVACLQTCLIRRTCSSPASNHRLQIDVPALIDCLQASTPVRAESQPIIFIYSYTTISSTSLCNNIYRCMITHEDQPQTIDFGTGSLQVMLQVIGVVVLYIVVLFAIIHDLHVCRYISCIDYAQSRSRQ